MIIVNADDFGRSESINDAIVYAFDNNIINRTSIMVNMPYVNEAVEIANKKNISDKIGLHLTLDEGYPLTEDIKNINLFCNNDGSFNGNFRRSKKNFLSLKDSYVRKKCEEEIYSQLQYYKSSGLTLFHIDSHHHVHTIPSILKIVVPMAQATGFKSMRIRFNMQNAGLVKTLYTDILNIYISRRFNTTDYFCDSSFLTHKPCDLKTYEIMCHPDKIDGHYVDVIGERRKGIFLDLSHIGFLLK